MEAFNFHPIEFDCSCPLEATTKGAEEERNELFEYYFERRNNYVLELPWLNKGADSVRRVSPRERRGKLISTL